MSLICILGIETRSIAGDTGDNSIFDVKQILSDTSVKYTIE